MQCIHAHPTPTPTPTFNPTPAPDQVAAYKSEDDPDKKDRALTALVPFLQYLAITRPPDLAAEMEDVRKQFPDVPLAEACELKLAELRAAGKLQEHPPTHTHTPYPSPPSAHLTPSPLVHALCATVALTASRTCPASIHPLCTPAQLRHRGGSLASAPKGGTVWERLRQRG